MTERQLHAEAGEFHIKGEPLKMEVTRGAESWQFFAFVFAAAVTLALTLIDEIPDRYQSVRIISKLVAFLGLAQLLLRNDPVRNWLVDVLTRFKLERR